MNSSTISETQQIVKDRDVNETKEFVRQQLTSEEQDQLKGIAEKYVSQYFGQYLIRSRLQRIRLINKKRLWNTDSHNLFLHSHTITP